MISKQSPLYGKITTYVQHITDASLSELSGCITRKHLKKGDKLLHPGQICRVIAFVEKGYFRTFVVKDGVEINTDFVFENSFVTNIKSLRLSIPSESTIEAGEDATVAQFDKTSLLKLYKASPEIESFGRNLLEELLMAQEEHANLFKILSAKERYNYLQTHHPEVTQRISLSHISSYLGVARETLSRIRKLKD